MRRTILVTVLSWLAVPAWAEDIGSVGYRFKWLGPNDKIVVEAFDDPDIPGVTCYISRARTGGIKGALGLAEDAPDASMSCHQVAPIAADGVRCAAPRIPRLPRSPAPRWRGSTPTRSRRSKARTRCSASEPR